jgi:Xaa-Pro aminopeptidase
MFEPKVYSDRRNKLRSLLSDGIIILPGNKEASMNYPANTYHFRQDSNFLYYFGLNQPDLIGIIDLDEDRDILFGNDVDIDDIIWMGPQPTMKERGSLVGVTDTYPLDKAKEFIQSAIAKGRKVRIVPPYRGKTLIQLEDLLGVHHSEVKNFISEELQKAIISMRAVKEDREIAEIEKAINTAYLMHTTAMSMAMPGVYEREIAGTIEGIALSQGGPVSFPIIQTINGQTLHNHYHGNMLTEGRMLVTDCGAETELGYCSDITRTVPVGLKFSQKQKEIYEIVLRAETESIKACKPGLPYKDLHLLAAKYVAEGLKGLGLMKGDVDEAVNAGAHALFFPHGLGHMMGLDVHDMEGLGENLVGYTDEVQRSKQFGLAFLRMARTLEPGYVMTNEPGIYFIPALIDLWKKDNKFAEFINYDKVETYRDFGGVRIEDDILVTETGHRILGKPIPKTVAEIEGMA